MVHSASLHTQPGSAESSSSSDPRVVAVARALYNIHHARMHPFWMHREPHPERYVWGEEAVRIVAVLDALGATTSVEGPSVGTQGEARSEPIIPTNGDSQ